VPRGVDVPPLDRKRIWEFKGTGRIKEGSMVSGGDVFATCFENNLFDEHKILLPPRVQGKVTYIAPDGNYNLDDKVIEVHYHFNIPRLNTTIKKQNME
jgi:V-type H+-transporting ATPase subunit A